MIAWSVLQLYQELFLGHPVCLLLFELTLWGSLFHALDEFAIQKQALEYNFVVLLYKGENAEGHFYWKNSYEIIY